jgi:type IV fimbrial biogenesis protein FimT
MGGMNLKGHVSGFTLTELVVTMSVAAILLAIAIPSFKYVTVSNRISTELNGLVGDLQYARSLAIKQGLQVTVCISTDGKSCGGAVVGSTWQSGWIVFLDSNGNQFVDVGESVMRTQPPFSSTDTFEPAGATALTAVTFNREGYATTGSTTPVTLELHDVTSNQAWTRCLAISPVGMLTSLKYNGGNCQ